MKSTCSAGQVQCFLSGPTSHLSPSPSLPHLHSSPNELLPGLQSGQDDKQPLSPPTGPNPDFLYAGPFSHPAGVLHTIHHSTLSQVSYPPRISPETSHLSCHYLLGMLITALVSPLASLVVLTHNGIWIPGARPCAMPRHTGTEFGKWMNEEFLTPCYRDKMVLYSRAGKTGFT